MQSEAIAIKKVVNGGYGLGFLDSGQVVLVPHTLPGERVLVEIVARRSTVLYGRLERVLLSHPQRRPPPCPYLPDCGGCNLQHATYPAQLELKRAILGELLADSDIRPEPPPLLPSAGEFGYRQRLRLQVGERGQTGFHSAQSHRLVPVAACLLAESCLNEVLALFRSHPGAQKLLAQTSELELLRRPQDDRVVALFHLRRRPRPADIQTAARLCADLERLVAVYFQGKDWPLTGPIGAAPPLRLEIVYPDLIGGTAPLRLGWEVGGFCQVNLAQNRRLIETVLAMAGAVAGQRVLDLFCGMGNFAIPLALAGAEVVGWEGQGSAIRAATTTAGEAGLRQVAFHKGAVHTACRHLLAAGDRFDLVVVDPPRAGLPDLAPALARLCVDRLIAISCDPATLRRDLAALREQGFSVKSLQAIDMFPQTHHIETVALLHRR